MNSIVEQVIHGATGENRVALSEIESKRILEALGIATQMPYAASTADEAASLATRCGFPVVLKVLSPDVTHKSDVGGVVLGLRSEPEVRAAFERIRANLAAGAPRARFEGTAVQAMAAPGIELLAGIARDPQFGPIVMVGLGGIFVEVLKDTAVRVAPVSEGEARAMLAELRGAPILKGIRGAAPADLDAIVALLVTISDFAARRSEIKEMDLNPIVAYPRGLSVLDARVLLDRTEGGGRVAGDPDPQHRERRLKNLARGLKPRVVAVIGDREMRQYQWLRATAHFKGTRYSVQSDPREDAGLAALKVPNLRKVADVPEPIDYAIVAVPRKAAPQILAECAAAGVATVGFFTAGFSEVGDELGRKLEAELRKVADASDVAVVGPNCMGLCNPGLAMLNAPSLRPGPPDGDVCFISQSGTHAIGLCMKAPTRGIKVSTAASIGNATVLEAADYLEVMAADPATRAIGIYIEGVRDGRRFLENLKRATARIPVVIWKGGVTEAGARATFSHTGSLATPSAVWKAAMRQGGAVEVINFDAMLDALELITRARFPVRGRKMGLVAMTGGQSVVISDAFARHGLEVPALSQKSYDEFATFFQVIGGSYRNPLDASWTMGPRGDPNAANRVLDILDRDPVIDAIVMEFRPGPSFGGPPGQAFREEDMLPLIDRLAAFNNRASKPFAVALETGHTHPDMDAGIIDRAMKLARERGLVTIEGFERAAAAFAIAAECTEARTRAH